MLILCVNYNTVAYYKLCGLENAGACAWSETCEFRKNLTRGVVLAILQSIRSGGCLETSNEMGLSVRGLSTPSLFGRASTVSCEKCVLDGTWLCIEGVRSAGQRTGFQTALKLLISRASLHTHKPEGLSIKTQNSERHNRAHILLRLYCSLFSHVHPADDTSSVLTVLAVGTTTAHGFFNILSETGPVLI
jgi:hypothetical protein